MKYFLILLFTISSFAQSKDTLTVSAENKNVVYRGIDNPVTIGVEGVDASKIIVTGPGVTKGEGGGNYIIRPGSGTQLEVSVSYKNSKGKTVTEKRIYTIEPFPQLEYTVNGEHKVNNTYSLTKTQLQKLKIGTTYIPECSLFDKAKVKSFMLKVPGYKTVLCNGGSLNAEALRIISKLSFNGETIIIDNIIVSRVEGYNVLRCKVSPVIIKLIH